MGNLFLDRLPKEILVMSGAMGTMLHQAGADLAGCIGQWIIEHPDEYRQLVKEYFQAGCDIVAGATFSLNRISLTKFGLQEKVEELNRGVIRIIKEIKPAQGFVAGNLGPSGKLLQPLGELSSQELMEAYAEQARILAGSGAEIINIITMYDLEEAVLALRAAKKFTSLPVIASLAFDPAAKGYRTMMGASPEAVARRLEEEGADVIGANCGRITLGQMTEVIRLMKDSCRKPLMAKPNAGSPQVVEGEEKYTAGPDEFAGHVGDWIQAGARIVSACCGSGPAHLRKMVERLRETEKPKE
ncbi:MAG: hypothetical protein FJ115_00175 [Deltaproteobacteria bacterium]|nr:hypothetical protein [Deltaproteobacteria bacterium]MBM4321945.1 hypothetical protein [Deltaproteobacteria bacterium]